MLGSKVCGTCAHFVPAKTLDEWGQGAEAEEGECHRNPPAFDSSNDYWGTFPRVHATDFCGEHRESEEEE